MDFLFYRDIFGGWRWEFRDPEGEYRDSRYSYPTREHCAEAARRAGLTASTPPEPVVPAKPAILCIHADPMLRDSLQQALAGYRTSLACTGLESIRLINSSVFDAYVIDYRVPGSSGLHVCRHIRRSDQHTPICFYTTHASEEARRRAFSVGASSFVCASAGPQALYDELGRFLDVADAQNARAAREEELAIQEELRRRGEAALARTERARQLVFDASQRTARAMAYKQFIEAGGTRAYFERSWPGLLAAASMKHDESAANKAA